MKKLAMPLILVLAAGAANAANTLTVSSCTSSDVTFTWNVDNLSDLDSIQGASGSDSENYFDYLATTTSGTQTVDFASKWDGSNANLTLELVLTNGNSIAASCP